MTEHIFISSESELFVSLKNVLLRQEKAIVLVRNQQSERQVRLFLQEALGGFAPAIFVLDTWLVNQILPRLAPSSCERMINRQEREALVQSWLDEWEEFASLRAASERRVVSRWLAELPRLGLAPDAFLREKPDSIFAALLQRLTSELRRRKWVLREEIPLLAGHISGYEHEHHGLVLFDLPGLNVAQKRGLSALVSANRSGKACVYVHLGVRLGWGATFSAPGDLFAPELQALSGERRTLVDMFVAVRSGHIGAKRAWPDDSVTLSPYLNTVQEALSVCSHIAGSLADGRVGGVDEVLLLCADVDTYRSALSRASEATGIPLFISKRPSLHSHPLVNQFFTLLHLPDEDILNARARSVFGTQLLDLKHYSLADEGFEDNVRNYESICRTYNLRSVGDVERRFSTLHEAKLREELARLEQREVENAQEVARKVKARFARDERFVLGTAKALRRVCVAFLESPRSVYSWVFDLLLPFFMRQRDFKRDVNNNVAGQFFERLREFALRYQSLSASEPISFSDVRDLLKAYLAEISEAVPDEPFSILVTEPGQLPFYEGKVVYFLGFSEGQFPAPEHQDYVQFQFSSVLSKVSDVKPDRQEIAGKELLRMLCGARELHLSRAQQSGSGGLSLLWQELTYGFDEQDIPRLSVPKFYSNIDLWRQEIACGTDIELGERPFGLLRRRAVEECSHIQEPTAFSGLLFADASVNTAPYKASFEQWWKQIIARFSITKLNRWVQHPQQFFVGEVLNLQPKPKFSFDIDNRLVGNLIHAACERFYRDAHPPIWPNEKSMGQAREHLDAVLQRLFSENETWLPDSSTIYHQTLKMQISATLTRWLELEEEAAQSWVGAVSTSYRPFLFYDESFLGLEENVEVFHGLDGQVVCLHGRADRIDTDEHKKTVVVVDYKSGSTVPKKANVAVGQDVQIPLYMMGLHQRGMLPLGGCYWKLKPGTTGKKKDLMELAFCNQVMLEEGVEAGKKAMDAYLNSFKEKVLERVLREIREGRFYAPFMKTTVWENDMKRLLRWDDDLATVRENLGKYDEQTRESYYCGAELALPVVKKGKRK